MENDTGQGKNAEAVKPWKIVTDIIAALSALRVRELGEIEVKNCLPPHADNE